MAGSDLSSHLSVLARELRPPALRRIHQLMARPGILSFALGMPSANLFPAEDFATAAAGVARSDPANMQYGIRFAPLRRHILDLLERRGVRCSQEQVFLTTGAQQALYLLASLLLDDGGEVILEKTVYEGILNAVLPCSPRILPVPTNPRDGIDVEAVEVLLKAGHRPAFLYAIADGHNPLGVSLNAEKRRALVEVARRFELPIIEDDVYGLLYYDGEPLAPLRALDEDWVIYVGSLSKLLAPGLRIGWMVVPEALMPKLSMLKHGLDLDVSNFVQLSVAGLLDGGVFPDHLAKLRREYRTRRDLMLAGLEKHFPSTVSWNHPSAGLYIWVDLPEGTDSEELLRRSVEEAGIAFCPGFAFTIERDDTSVNNALRLCFSNSSPEQIEDGIERLGRVVTDFCG